MNRNQIRGGFKDAAGKIQRKFGEFFGNDRQEARGTEKQAEGKTQRAVGDVTDTLGKTADNVKEIFRRQK